MSVRRSGKAKSSNSFRVIAGQWRGRVLKFSSAGADLRPTTDRVRETLFNWLQAEIRGATCLDLFAGSGALSFEALSRGAAGVTAMDLSGEVVKSLEANGSLLRCERLVALEAEALAWLASAKPERRFDIVFLDPPYAGNLLPRCCALLEERDWLQAQGCVYLESNAPLEALPLPGGWRLSRSRKAGKVHYGLCRKLGQ